MLDEGRQDANQEEANDKDHDLDSSDWQQYRLMPVGTERLPEPRAHVLSASCNEAAAIRGYCAAAVQGAFASITRCKATIVVLQSNEFKMRLSGAKAKASETSFLPIRILAYSSKDCSDYIY